MKKLIGLMGVLLFAGLTNGLLGQDYAQWQIIYVKPDPQHLAEFAEGMKAHNDTYHAQDPYHVTVWRVATGPMSGWLVWSMGPATFVQMNEGPGGNAEHDTHWVENVMAHLKDLGTTEFWRMNTELSSPPPDEPNTKLRLRFYKVNIPMGFLVGEIMEVMSETSLAQPEGRPFYILNNLLQQGDIGRHFVTITPFDNWGDLDDGMQLDPSVPGTFRATFDELYGANAWQGFQNRMSEAIQDSYDEIWVRVDAMSAPLPGN